EEGPGGAVDRKAERVDQQPGSAGAPDLPQPVAIARNYEQQADIAERNGDNDPALQHHGLRPFAGSFPPRDKTSQIPVHGYRRLAAPALREPGQGPIVNR